jgi:hypothetical protein
MMTAGCRFHESVPLRIEPRGGNRYTAIRTPPANYRGLLAESGHGPNLPAGQYSEAARGQVEPRDSRGLEFSFMISVLLMPHVAPLVTEAQAASLDASSQSSRFRGGLPRTLVATGYGRRDWFLRRLLAVSDIVCLAVAMTLALALAGGSRGHSWQELLLYGLITLPAWVVLFKLYGLYERDAKRLSHSTLDDLPSLFHAVLLGCLLTWCWFVVVAPAKLVFTAVLVFGALAMMLVLAGRVLTRAGFVRKREPAFGGNRNDQL